MRLSLASHAEWQVLSVIGFGCWRQRKQQLAAKEYDDQKAIDEDDAVVRTKEAHIVKKEADEEYRMAVAKRKEAVQKRDECAAEVKRLQELLRLAMLALDEAEDVARLAHEVEEQREREAEAAAQVPPTVKPRCRSTLTRTSLTLRRC